MKILLISDEYPPHGGGAGTVAKQLYTDLIKCGHNVFCITNEDVYSVRTGIAARFFWLNSYFKYIDKNIDLFSFDVIICNDLKSILVAGKFFSDQILEKTRIIIHGSENKIIYESPSVLNKIRKVSLYFDRALKKSNKIVFVSDYLKMRYFDSNINVFKNEYVKLKSVVAYAGINEELIHLNNVKNVDRKILGNDDVFRLVSASRVIKSKGYIQMIDLIKSALEQGINIEWHIFGDGKDLGLIKRMTNKANIEYAVQFFGGIERNDLLSRLNQYDAFFLLPNTQESFGLVFIEAASQGIPSITVEKYGIKEAVFENESGCFIDDIESFISALLKIKNRKFEFRLNCLNHAKKFLSMSFAKKVIL